MIDYRYLSAFLSVAKTGNISESAQELGVAQSAISRQIRLFEESVETQLFFRGSRGVNLTQKGIQLYQQLQSIDRWVHAEFDSQPMPIRIGGLEGAIHSCMMLRLKNVPSGELPLDLSIQIMSNNEIENALENDRIDIGLSSRKFESNRISSLKLYSEKIVLISSEKVELEEIHQYRWIGIQQMEYLKRIAKGKKPKAILRAGSVTLLLELVKAGHGIAAVPDSFARGQSFSILPLPIHGEAIYLNLSAYQQQPADLRHFVKWLMLDRKSS